MAKKIAKLNVGGAVASSGGKCFKKLAVNKPTEGLEYTLSNDGTYYICTGMGTATDTDIIIADEIDGIKVKHIGANAFSGCTSLVSITFSKYSTLIGGSAFSGCTNLKSIIIAHGIVAIPSNAFSGCTNLESVAIPYSCKRISDGAFSGCDKLKNVYYSSSAQNWYSIVIGDDNTALLTATRHCV